ncbi:uncharacterized protein LOC134222636 [Armigeres subalbatus]|uniref:uncharacterized protein LOC134222636 n=1 Tax=Armigeres subalbatus TaxID=124917 RepID=UPI002ED634B4
MWLLEEVKCKHKLLSVIEEQLYSLHLQLLNQVAYHTSAECIVYGCAVKKNKCWQAVLGMIDRNLAKRVRVTKQIHNKKLHSLAHAQKPKKTICSPQNIENFVVNLSSEQLTPNECDLLNKGLNFAMAPQYAPLADIVSNIESAIQYNNYSLKSALRHDLERCIVNTARKQDNVRQTTANTIKAIRQLKARDVIYSRADKGNAV